MASRFWVGGGASTNWNATANTNWAASSGGANNASVPTTTDDVFFDANSGSGASVLSAAITVQSVNFTGFTGTFTHNGFTLTINTGTSTSMVFGAGMTYSPASTSSIIAFTNTTGTADITSNGKRMAALTMNGVGGTLRMLDALRVDAILNAVLTITNGVFNANNFTVTACIVSSNNSNTRTITMGSGLWLIGGNVSAIATIWNLSTVTGLTFNKNTANIEIAASTTSPALGRFFAGGGLTYNTLTIDANSGNSQLAITGANTFAALAVGYGNAISIPGNTTTTVTAAPTWTGTQASPILIYSNSSTAAILSIASGTLALTWGAVRDVTGTGGANFVATNTLDFGNNSGWSISKPADALTAPLDAAGTRAALGLASANLDTQIGSVQTDTTAIKGKTNSLTFTVAGMVDSNVVDWKGATAPAMTGDAYARLGAPAGASVSADVAAVKSDTGNIGTAGAGLTALGDTRIAHLDADVSTRATPTNITAGTITTVTNLTNAPTVGDLTATMKASVTAAVPTANANADALLDRADAVEAGLTPRQAMRLSAASDAGKLSGAATSTNTIRNAVADSKNRIVATTDADGNRTAITYDLT